MFSNSYHPMFDECSVDSTRSYCYEGSEIEDLNMSTLSGISSVYMSGSNDDIETSSQRVDFDKMSFIESFVSDCYDAQKKFNGHIEYDVKKHCPETIFENEGESCFYMDFKKDCDVLMGDQYNGFSGNLHEGNRAIESPPSDIDRLNTSFHSNCDVFMGQQYSVITAGTPEDEGVTENPYSYIDSLDYSFISDCEELIEQHYIQLIKQQLEAEAELFK